MTTPTPMPEPGYEWAASYRRGPWYGFATRAAAEEWLGRRNGVVSPAALVEGPLRTPSEPTGAFDNHEPHGHCRVCHIGVHRYRDGKGCLSRWRHVNSPGVPIHQPDPVVTCCTVHGRT